MTAGDGFDQRLDEFFGEGPNEIADWVIAASLADIETTPQWRVGFDPRRLFMRIPPWIAVGATAVVAVAVIAILLIPRGQTGVAGQPSASPPPASAAPSPFSVACTPNLPDPTMILGECTYNLSPLGVAATIQGRSHWLVDGSGPKYVRLYVDMDNVPPNANALSTRISILDHTFSQPCHTPGLSPGTPIPYTATTPDAFWAWLRQKVPMLTYDTPVPVTIGGIRGLQATNTTRQDQITSACRANDAVDLGDLGGENTIDISAGAGSERLTALVVNGKTILIDLSILSDSPMDLTDAAFFPTFAQEADALLGTIQWKTGSRASAAPAGSGGG